MRRREAERKWHEMYPEITEQVPVQDYNPSMGKIVGVGPDPCSGLIRSIPGPEYYIVRRGGIPDGCCLAYGWHRDAGGNKVKGCYLKHVI